MNKRIKELQLRAYVYAVDASKTYPYQCKIGSDYFLNLKDQKFAELIVQECMNLTEGCRDKYLNSAPYKIAKHFGVE